MQTTLTGLAAQLAEKPARLRQAVWWAAVLVATLSVSAVVVVDGDGSAMVGTLLATAVLLLSWLAGRDRSYLVTAVGAGVMAVAVASDATLLTPAVTALMVITFLDDPAPRPWVGWLAGVGGAVAGMLVYGFFGGSPTSAGLVGAILGGVLGLLVRQLDRTDALTRRTRQLEDRSRASEDQARWLEQRTNLARELHDVVGHHVTAMVVQAEAGQVARPEQALAEIARLGRTALGELDALVVHLRDPEADLVVSAPPRLADIDELLAAPLRSSGVVVVVEVAPDLELTEVQVMTVYRIAQEALTNVTRHAGASHAWVEVAPAARHVRLRVSDDGSGPPVAPERGSGLIGIEERVSALGGMWTISSRPGGGTIVDVFLPLTTAGPVPAAAP